MTAWPRVNRRRPCAICQHPDFCQVSPDGQIAKCMRISAGSFESGTSPVGEYYLHRPGDAVQDDGLDQQHGSTLAVQPAATPGVRDALYSYMLDVLTLSPEHAVNLLGRGLDEGAVTRNSYATAPSQRRMSELLTAASEKHDPTGVPGIYRVRNGRWKMQADEGDLLIPVRDARWRIVALMRRTNRNDNRYRWLSCNEAPSGAPAHHAEPWNAEFRRAIYITEGQLKADVLAANLGFTTIGLAGCGSIPAGFTTQLREDYPAVCSVFIAFDADASTNPSVACGRDRLIEYLMAAAYRVHLLEWDMSDGKGLDDVLRQEMTA